MKFVECKDPHVAIATDGIDAAIFSGPFLHKKANRKHLRYMMARWERAMAAHEKFLKEEKLIKCDKP